MAAPESEALNAKIDSQTTALPPDFRYEIRAGNLSPRQVREVLEEFKVKFYQEDNRCWLQCCAEKAQ